MKERCLEFGNRTEKEGPKHCSSVARTIPTPNRGLKRSDLLQKSCKTLPVTPRLSYQSTTSDGTRIRLRTGLKWALEWTSFGL